MSREAAYTALFSLLAGLKTSGAVKACSRRVKLMEKMGPAELPALFMSVGGQKVEPRKGLPPKRTLGAKVFLYVFNPDANTAAGIQLNNLIDAVEAALAPNPLTNVQTLGGIVDHAWIEGQVEVFDGPLGEKAAAILSVNMLVP